MQGLSWLSPALGQKWGETPGSVSVARMATSSGAGQDDEEAAATEIKRLVGSENYAKLTAEEIDFLEQHGSQHDVGMVREALAGELRLVRDRRLRRQRGHPLGRPVRLGRPAQGADPPAQNEERRSVLSTEPQEGNGR